MLKKKGGFVDVKLYFINITTILFKYINTEGYDFLEQLDKSRGQTILYGVFQ